MMQKKLLSRIEALLHHPPERALGKEDDTKAKARAAEYLKIVLGEYLAQSTSEITVADRIGAGANEYHFPDQQHPGNLSEGIATFDWTQDPVLRHPLSGQIYRFGPGDLPNPADASNQITLALKQLADVAGHSGEAEEVRLRKLALMLWRAFPDLLEGTDELNNLWSHIPAEPRIPDHSVWEHLSLTAALTSAGIGPETNAWDEHEQPSKASLLLFTIGPVQGFIGSAQKTRDLEAGSFLISYLTWQAIRLICERYGPEAVLFPDLRRQPLVDLWLKDLSVLTDVSALSYAATIPNRFFAVIPDADADEVGRDAAAAVRNEFANIAAFTLQELLGPESRDPSWHAHLELAREYFECYWSILPFHRLQQTAKRTFIDAFKHTYEGYFDWDDDQANDILKAFEDHGNNPNVGAVYGRLYHLTDAIAGSRKSLRDFKVLPESGYRCSLIPSLPALTPPRTGTTDERSPGEVNKFWAKLAKRTERHLLKESEQLSLVALARRYLYRYGKSKSIPMPEGHFPSTGSFATADFKRDVMQWLCEPVVDEGQEEKLGQLRQKLNKFKQAMASIEVALNGLSEEPLQQLKKLANRDPGLEWLACLDGGWLFQDAFDPVAIAKEYGFDKNKDEGLYSRSESGKQFSDHLISEASKALGELLEATSNLGIAPPSKYYAILQMDGDQMGYWLSGEKAPSFSDVLHPAFINTVRTGAEKGVHKAYDDWAALIDGAYRRPLTPALHLAISRALGTFALDLVRPLVEEQFMGRLIYSGGDDVLAFVSFRDALHLSRHLRAAFSGQVVAAGDENAENPRALDVAWENESGFVRLEKNLRLTMGHTATASTGVVLVHYKHSLRHALREAHHACEDYAKDTLGRDALGISTMKRSGEFIQAGTRWTSKIDSANDGHQYTDLVEALYRFADLVNRGLVATGFLYDVEMQTETLLVFEGSYNEHIKGKRDLSSEQRIRLETGWHETRMLEPLTLELLRSFKRHTQVLKNVEPDKLPLWLKGGGDLEERDYIRTAFHLTIETLLMHNPIDQVIRLLDAGQFIGQGGDR